MHGKICIDVGVPIMRGVTQLPVPCPVLAKKLWDTPGTHTGLVGTMEAPGKPMLQWKLQVNGLSQGGQVPNWAKGVFLSCCFPGKWNSVTDHIFCRWISRLGCFERLWWGNVRRAIQGKQEHMHMLSEESRVWTVIIPALYYSPNTATTSEGASSNSHSCDSIDQLPTLPLCRRFTCL